MTDDRLTCS